MGEGCRAVIEFLPKASTFWSAGQSFADERFDPPLHPPSYQDFHESLRHELERLLAFGYIQRIPGKGIRTFFQMKGRIGDHFELTHDGHAVLAVLGGPDPV